MQIDFKCEVPPRLFEIFSRLKASLAVCLALNDFFKDYYLVEPSPSKFCTIVRMIINIFCTGKTSLITYSVF